MRDLHEQMLAAVIDGDGLDGIAELAAAEVGAPVAILLPGHGLSAGCPADAATETLETWAKAAIEGRNGTLPSEVDISVPVISTGTDVGRVVALAEGRGAPLIDREEVLRWAALAALTELAVIEARDQLAEELRGTFIEDVRTGGLVSGEVIRRGRRLGCDLSAGVIAIAAEAGGGRPRYMTAIVGSVAEQVIAEPVGGRVFALLPLDEGSGGPSAARERALEIVKRLRPHGPVAASSPHGDPADAGRALEEAELMLEIVARDPRLAEQLEGGIPTGVYRLLFRALASNPSEVMRFYEDTVATLVTHDIDHKTDLLATLDAYLANNCNMRATAEAVYAHRHTVAHRLERIKELTGLDPASGEDRERLGLGLKAYRLIEPTLPR